MTPHPCPTPALVPLTAETDVPRVVQIVSLTWTPDVIENDDYIADCEPVLIVKVRS